MTERIRLAAAFAVILSCTSGGTAFARASRRRYRLLKELADALERLRLLVAVQGMDLKGALERSGAEPLMRTAKMLGASDAETAWRRTADALRRRGACADCMREEELMSLDRLFAVLGRTGREEQSLAIGQCAAEIIGLRDRAREKAIADGRLYVSLGALLGMAAAVMLI